MSRPLPDSPLHLVIFKVNQLGDNVVFLPTVQQLVAALPAARLTVITSPVAEPLYRATCPTVRTATFETRTFNGSWRYPLRLLRFCRTIRAMRPDACMLGDDQSNVAHLVARLSGARTTVGPLLADRKLGFLLHHREPICQSDHVALQNWRIARRLLQLLGPGADRLPDFPPLPDLSAFGARPGGGILIHAGASREYKRWPLDRYIQLANRLVASRVVTWINQNAAEESGLDPRVRRRTPPSLADFIADMAGAAFFIGNNSGPMNIASALGCPGIIFNGPSTPNWDPPWHAERFDLLRDPAIACQPCDQFNRPVNSCQNQAHPMVCMTRWTVEEVMARVPPVP